MRPKQKAQKKQTVSSITRSTTNAAAAAVAAAAIGTMSSSSQPSTSNGIISNGVTRQSTPISKILMPSSSSTVLRNEGSASLSTPTSSSVSVFSAAIQRAQNNNMNVHESIGDEQRQQTYVANSKLCRLVRRNPWLFNRKHLNYGKKVILDKTWLKIAKDCDDTVSSCKERWRNIRAAYARSVNLYKTNTGPNRVKPYYLHKELNFLLKPMSEGRNRNQLSVQDGNQAEEEDEEELDDDESNEVKAETHEEFIDASLTMASIFEEKPTTSDDHELNNDQSNQNNATADAAGGGDDDDDDDDDDHEMPLIISSARDSNSFLDGSNMCEITLDSLPSEEFNTPKDNESAEFGPSHPKRRHLYDESEAREPNVQQHRSIATITMIPITENDNNNQSIVTNSPQKQQQQQQQQQQQHLNNSCHICDISTSTTMRAKETSVDFCAAPSRDCHKNNSADRKFLEALLPDMSVMSARQKIIFKRKIYQILEEVFDVATDFPKRHEQHHQNHHQCHNYNDSHDITTTTTTTTATQSGGSSSIMDINSSPITMLPPQSSTRLSRLSLQASSTPRKTPSTSSHPPASSSLVSSVTQKQQQKQQRRTITLPSDNIKIELKDDDVDEDFVSID